MEPDFLTLHNEEDPERVATGRRTQTIRNGLQRLPHEAYLQEDLQEGGAGTVIRRDVGVGRDPSYDEPPRPRKRVKKPTVTQIIAQNQAQIEGVQKQMAGLTEVLTTLSQVQASQQLPPLASQFPVPEPVYASQPLLPQTQFGYAYSRAFGGHAALNTTNFQAQGDQSTINNFIPSQWQGGQGGGWHGGGWHAGQSR